MLKMKFFLSLLILLLLLIPNNSFAQDIATCGKADGYSYFANRGLVAENSVGWTKDKISEGKFTFRKNSDGKLDLLTSGVLGVSSALEEGANIIPASISEEAVTIIVIYPNKLTETYVFQTLKDGNYQSMWTQAKPETPLPKITAFISECSFLDLSGLK